MWSTSSYGVVVGAIVGVNVGVGVAVIVGALVGVIVDTTVPAAGVVPPTTVVPAAGVSAAIGVVTPAAVVGVLVRVGDGVMVMVGVPMVGVPTPGVWMPGTPTPGVPIMVGVAVLNAVVGVGVPVAAPPQAVIAKPVSSTRMPMNSITLPTRKVHPSFD